jgi:hypothetical protein
LLLKCPGQPRQIHDNPLSWLGLDTSIKNDTPDTQIHDNPLVSGVSLVIEVPKPSQESGLKYICVSGVSLVIEVPRPTQESGLSCICVSGVSPIKMIHLTHKYITIHFPGLA